METISRYLVTFLLNSLWQISSVAAVAMLARLVMRRGPAAYQHTVLVAAMIASIALPLTSVRPREPGPAMQFRVSSPEARAALSHALPAPRPPLGRLNPVRPQVTRSIGFSYPMAFLFSSAYLIF